MNRKRFRFTTCGLLLAAIVFLVNSVSWCAESSAILTKVVIKVDDRAQAADNLVRIAGESGGYFIHKSRDTVNLRLPSANLTSFFTSMDQLGEVVSRKLQREDVGTELLQKNAALTAKIETQNQYLEILEKADTEGALYVEGELIQLVREIEELKGRIRHLQHRISFAAVEVAFDYRDRSIPPASGNSSFAWLNTMNLNELLEDF
jgi:hypothetical protein